MFGSAASVGALEWSGSCATWVNDSAVFEKSLEDSSHGDGGSSGSEDVALSWGANANTNSASVWLGGWADGVTELASNSLFNAKT